LFHHSRPDASFFFSFPLAVQEEAKMRERVIAVLGVVVALTFAQTRTSAP